jgi:hypothetical protein
MKLPPLTIVMTMFIPPQGGPYGGFSRFQSAKQTIMSWGRHMRYSGELRLYVANDSVAITEEEAEEIKKYSALSTAVVHTHGLGLGGALNEGLRRSFEDSPLAIYADDSYSLIEDINFDPWATVLMRNDDIGAVSLMPPRPEQSGGRCLYFHQIRTEGVAGVVFERQGYTWNGRPLMYHKRFFDVYGWTPEGGTGYEWEQQYAEHFTATPGPDVLYAFIDPWQHVWSVLLGNAPPGWSGENP